MIEKLNKTQSPGNYVVIDTNIWVYSTRLLTTALGAALLYAVSRTNSRLALPEVIEQEIRKHTINRGVDAVNKINESYQLIEMLMGHRDDYRVPSQDDLLKRVDERFAELSEVVHRVPFTFPHARGALTRVLEETPPNGYKDQQFKDSAIWEAVLELSKDGEVHFVTKDKAFFVDRKPEKGLAANLKEEANGRIQVFYGVSSFLDQIREEIPKLGEKELAQKISDSLSKSLLERATEKEYEIGGLESHKMTFYLTEKAQLLAVDFELEYAVRGLKSSADQPPVSGLQKVKGNCGYDIRQDSVEDVSIERIETFSVDGEPLPGFGLVVLGVGSVVIGRRTIPYKLREPLQ
jgi:predicted nucleic acid-binding protein